MDSDAFYLHDGVPAMLREGDAVHRNMEGSMTPERIAEIFAEETGDDIDASESALQDFARRMWNEALSEALKPAMSEAIFWSDSGDTRAYAACELIIGAINAMKLEAP